MAAKMFLKHPWFGSGVGHWKIVFAYFKTPGGYWRYAHNDFLQATFEMGIGFVAILIGYIVELFRRFKGNQLIPITGLIIVILNATVNFPFHIGQTALMAITWAGLLEVYRSQSQGEHKCQTTK